MKLIKNIHQRRRHTQSKRMRENILHHVAPARELSLINYSTPKLVNYSFISFISHSVEWFMCEWVRVIVEREISSSVWYQRKKT